MSDAPFRIGFDEARDPYAARVALRSAVNPVPTDQIADGAITTAKIADGAVTAIKLADTYATAANFPAGAWTTWSPTITSSAGTLTSTTVNLARYTKMGKTVHAYVSITVVTAGTGSGYLNFTLPVTAHSGLALGVSGREINNTGVSVTGNLSSTTLMSLIKYDGSTFIANGAAVLAMIVYEAA